MIYINFKTYPAGTGPKAVEMADMIRRVSLVTGIPVIPVVQAFSAYQVSQINADWAWGQHADAIEYGSNTGWILPEAWKQSGINGVVLNHAEHKVDFNILEQTVDRCRAVGLTIGICADSLEEVKKVLPLTPDWIAYEPPELIGRSDISVATAEPEVVKSAVQLTSDTDTKLLIGAGIHDANDIRIGLELGADGFLIASAVMTADNPEAALRQLLTGYSD